MLDYASLITYSVIRCFKKFRTILLWSGYEKLTKLLNVRLTFNNFTIYSKKEYIFFERRVLTQRVIHL